jgi:hypothetical protein
MANLSQEVLGFGTDLLYGDTADYATASSYTSVATELVDIEPPTHDADAIKTKHFKSTSQWETSVPGWGKSGDVKFKAHFSPAEFNTLVGFHRVPKAYKVVFANYPYGGGSSSASATGDVIKFNGWLKTIGVPVDLDGLVEVECTIDVSGKPAIA